MPSDATDTTLFDLHPSADSQPHNGWSFAVGQRFTFRGLEGQEGYDSPLPGGGSVGWTIELTSLSPSGSLSVLCTATAGDPSTGCYMAVPLPAALAMIAEGAWVPLAQ